MVRSLGDLAKLDEPEYSLRREAVDVSELLDDIVLRFAERAAQQGVAVRALPARRRRRRGAALRPDRRRAVRAGDRQPGRQRAQVLPRRQHRDADGAARARRRSRSASPTTGPGIAAADLPQLFDRFYQSRATVAPATGDGGRGLGLAIVKRIVELHEGEVAVESRLGHGTRVTTLWPAAG